MENEYSALRAMVVAEIGWDWRDKVGEYLDRYQNTRRAYQEMYLDFASQSEYFEIESRRIENAMKEEAGAAWDDFLTTIWPELYRTEIEPVQREFDASLDRILHPTF